MLLLRRWIKILLRLLTKYTTAVPITARDMGRELLAETVTRKDAGASPMDGFTACLSKRIPIHVSVCIIIG